MTQEIKTNEYQCAACKSIFEYGWSDEEARTEAKLTFGKPVEEWKDKAALVCDYCYKQMLPSKHPDALEYAKSKI